MLLSQTASAVMLPFSIMNGLGFPHADQHKASMQSLSLQREFEVALRQRLFRRFVSFRLPVAPVPKHDRAAGFEDAMQLEPQIIMQAGSVVLLDDKTCGGCWG